MRKRLLADKIIIFDYSGTLSLEMPLFARPDNLRQHLKESGLFDVGINNPGLFWEIINKTWAVGSTTRRGYKRTLEDGIQEFFPEKAVSLSNKITAAVAAFAEAYFAHSRIDSQWQPLLEKLYREKSVRVIIATDHYAEATAVIGNTLAAWKIKAAAAAKNAGTNFIIANSADLGFPKSARRFWEIVRDDVRLNCRHILLIDDFGQNEETGDVYSERSKVDERREKTIQLLQSVFSAEVQNYFFDMHGKSAAQITTEAAAAVSQFVTQRNLIK